MARDTRFFGTLGRSDYYKKFYDEYKKKHPQATNKEVDEAYMEIKKKTALSECVFLKTCRSCIKRLLDWMEDNGEKLKINGKDADWLQKYKEKSTECCEKLKECWTEKELFEDSDVLYYLATEMKKRKKSADYYKLVLKEMRWLYNVITDNKPVEVLEAMTDSGERLDTMKMPKTRVVSFMDVEVAADGGRETFVDEVKKMATELSRAKDILSAAEVEI